MVFPGEDCTGAPSISCALTKGGAPETQNIKLLKGLKKAHNEQKIIIFKVSQVPFLAVASFLLIDAREE